METQAQLGDSGSEASKRKRRAITRGQTACNPCRQRKVRCSYQLPCQKCVERQHPALCVYDAPQKRVSLDSTPIAPGSSLSAATPPTGPWTPSKSDWDELVGKIDMVEQGLRAVRRGLGHLPASTRPGTNNDSPTPDEAAEPQAIDLSRDVRSVHPVTGEPVFLGANSIPAMAMALSRSTDSDAVRDLVDKSILPIFTLENDSTTYPFVDLWGLPHASPARIEKLCGMLPAADSECLQYIRQYRDTAHVLFPGIINMAQFEADVMRFLVARTMRTADPDGAPPTDQGVYGQSVHWLGLLFACLASGYQCSGLQRRERQLISQVYGEPPARRLGWY